MGVVVSCKGVKDPRAADAVAVEAAVVVAAHVRDETGAIAATAMGATVAVALAIRHRADPFLVKFPKTRLRGSWWITSRPARSWSTRGKMT
jgi:hypothetical protein